MYIILLVESIDNTTCILANYYYCNYYYSLLLLYMHLYTINHTQAGRIGNASELIPVSY